MARYQALPSPYGQPAPRYRRPEKTADPFYLTPEWRALATAIKVARRYTCEACGADMNGHRRACHADHVVEIRDGGAPLDPLNVRVLCQRCHNAKTAKAAARR